MNESVIRVNAISKYYRTKVVLDKLSLSIPKGSVFGLLGCNGEGKTTLIKCLLGLLKVSDGEVRVLGDDPRNFKDTTKARIGYVPQMDRVYPWLTVRQLTDYTASFYPNWNHSLVNTLLKEWHVDTSEKFGVLSEGQAQKVSIILSLGHEPELLVLDEPVASLDPAARRQFLKLVLDIVSDRECTIFFSTHITSDLERVADHVALLKNGQIDFCGELDQLKDEVKRIRIRSDHAIPRDYQPQGCVYCEISDQQAIAAVRGFNPDVKSSIEHQLKAQVDVENLNLEEIFLELTR